ncbi:penicillin acylase family protein [Steroidobacter sp.]|uniref:penicillin acylase family protein n=1 Tax=Steroidobacter sp. TaxID=1978227 RepID=UPI001A4195B2|nr:penicillin acylase family protein [Steroidobacter sp.]MBL8268722.1 penicillin acylase family protein [Steroidobacter sp.]
MRILCCLVLIVALLPVAQASSVPAAAERKQLAGLQQPVEILRDPWGISHIYAQTEADLFFAQGYSAARDRLFQFELWRMQATGTAAAVFGPKELKRDIGARLHQFRGDLRQELNFYHPRGEAIVDAFVKGVNAYIAETERNPELLTLEFRLLGITPKRWTPDVVISRHQGLLVNVRSELANAKLLTTVGAERIRKLTYYQGGDPQLVAPPGLDLASLPEQVLELYVAFRDPMQFEPSQIDPQYRNSADSFKQMSASIGVIPNEPSRDIGSNNWVIAGERSQSTYPIMANDPHRAVTAPSLRYWVHLNAPGWNVIGGGEPVLPGVSIGHNEYGGWGLTIYGSDSEDLYVYDTDPANPDAYRYKNRWEKMRVIQDTIEVKGQAPVAVTYKYTRHGPVLFEDTAKRKAYALRAAWMDRGAAPYLASLRMNQAKSWEEFRAACLYNLAPAEAMVWADRQGNIGWQATGLRPRRPNWSGLLPVPGDGTYEWNGILPIEQLPHALNPSQGFLATANNFLMPVDFKFPDAMTYEWSDSTRADRISEMLSTGQKFNVALNARMQNDELSLPARELVPLLAGLPLTGVTAQARDRLLAWNYVLDKDSVAAGIYQPWQTRLRDNFRDLILGEELAKQKPRITASMKRMIDQLYAPGVDFGVDPLKGRDQLLVRSLEQAVKELTATLGPDMEGWRLGQEKHHHALIKHPLSSVVNEQTRARFDVGLAPRGGDNYTVNATGSGRQAAGASLKIIVDTEDWDNSIGQNTPGQSGDVNSPHYRDLFELWAQGKYFPILFSTPAVKSAARSRTLLEPGRAERPAEVQSN